MKCKKVRDLLSEYIDTELDTRVSSEIEEHLSTCAECGKLLKDILSSSVDPLRSAGKLRAPEYLWGRIRDRIEGEKPGARSVSPALFIYRPALSLATAAVIILIAFMAIKLPMRDTGAVARYETGTVTRYMEDQIEFFDYLADENGATQDVDMIDIGTTIERYLL